MGVSVKNGSILFCVATDLQDFFGGASYSGTFFKSFRKLFGMMPVRGVTEHCLDSA